MSDSSLQPTITEYSAARLVGGLLAEESFARLIDWVKEKQGGNELDWIEFKSVLIPASEDQRIQDGGPPDAVYIWHGLVRPILALANNIGGALIVGFADELLETVGLEKSAGWEKGADKFFAGLRKWLVVGKGRFPDWHVKKKCSKGTIELLEDIAHDAIEFRIACYDDKPILVVIVSPLRAQTDPGNYRLFGIRVQAEGAASSIEKFPIREKGDYGGIENFDVTKTVESERIASLRLQRSMRPDYFGQLWSELSDPLEAKIRKYRGSIGLGNFDSQRYVAPEIKSEVFFESDDVPEKDSNNQEEADWNFEDNDAENTHRVQVKADVSGINLLPICIVFGQCGSGKSWYLCQRKQRWIESYVPGSEVTIHLATETYEGTDIWDWCAKTRSEINAADWKSLADQNRLLILIDGLDRVKQQHRRTLYEHIRVLKRSNARALITSRPISIDANEFDNIPRFSIQPFNATQQKELRQKWLNANNLLQVGDVEVPEYLRKNPMLLTLSFQYRVSSPLELKPMLSPWDLYHNVIRQKDWFGEKGPIQQMAYLAFHTRAMGLGTRFSEEKAIEILVESGRLEKKSAQGLIAVLQTKALVDASAPDVVAFAHESWQEFLAAEHLISHPDDWQKIRTDPQAWRMVMAHALTGGCRVTEDLLGVMRDAHPALAFVACHAPGVNVDVGDATLQIPQKRRELADRFDDAFSIALRFIAHERNDDILKSKLLAEIKSPRALIYFAEIGIVSQAEFGIHDTVQSITPDYLARNPEEVFALLECGIIDQAVWQQLKPEVAPQHFSPFLASRHVSLGLFDKADLISNIKRSVKTVAMETACKVLKKYPALFDKADFDQRKPDWTASMSVGRAAMLMREGLFSYEDFDERRKEWALCCSSETQRVRWISTGVFTEKDLPTSSIFPLKQLAMETIGFQVQVKSEQFDYSQRCVGFLVEPVDTWGDGHDQMFLPLSQSGLMLSPSTKTSDYIGKTPYVIEAEPRSNGKSPIVLFCKGTSDEPINVGQDVVGVLTAQRKNNYPVVNIGEGRWALLQTQIKYEDIERNIWRSRPYRVVGFRKIASRKFVMVTSLESDLDEVNEFDTYKRLVDAMHSQTPVSGRVALKLTGKGRDVKVNLEIGLIAALHRSNSSEPLEDLFGSRQSFYVIDVSFGRRRIGLRYGLERLNPRDFQENEVLEGVVKSKVDYGYFIRLTKNERFFDALLHSSDIYMPLNNIVVGAKVEVVVKTIDTDDNRISLRTNHQVAL